MHQTKEQLYEYIKDLKTQEEFEHEIQVRYREYDGLLDEPTIALLLVDELGRNKQTILKIVDLKSDMKSTVFGKVTNVYESRRFTRKNGSSGRVINLELADETGMCRLVLWNKDVELVRNKTIQKGTRVKVVNGYVKNGFNGLELNVGRWSLLEIEPEDMPMFVKEKLANNITIKGTLIERDPTRVFFKETGEVGFVTTIKIEVERRLIRALTVWDEKVKELQGFKVGDVIEINHVNCRNARKNTELHVNGNSTIKPG